MIFYCKSKKILILLIYSTSLFLFNYKENNNNFLEFFISDDDSVEQQKLWVGGKYKIQLRKFPINKLKRVIIKIEGNKKVEINGNHLLTKSSGKECITVYLNKYFSKLCFTIYKTPKLFFKEKNPIKIETNHSKYLNLNRNDYPEYNIRYYSSHPDIINVDNKGKITAIRPGRALITASGLDNIMCNIKVIANSNNGLLSNHSLTKLNLTKYNNVMIVAHPDDEILWGGANLFKEDYFVICLTNGYNFERANEFRKILNFTRNVGLILNYPDLQDNIKDDWKLVKRGILQDLYNILNYKFWKKIVTHGPDGTGGHYHHIKTFEFVTQVAIKINKYDHLYYFAKYYNKKEIPKNIPRISDQDLKYKIIEVSLYKTKREIIYQSWLHMLPFENLILASNWNNIYEK